MHKLTAIQLILNAKGSFFVYTSENNGTIGFNEISFGEVDLIREWLKMRMDSQIQDNAVFEATQIINNGKEQA